MNKTVFHFLYIVLLISACTDTDGDDLLFEVLPPSKSGIAFQNTLTETEDANILDYLYFYNGGGVAVGDINNDGLPDIYFSGNQVENKLYLNKGNLQFEDITDSAGVSGSSDWNTGVAMADINADGFLDLYVCAVVGINGFQGHNELFINNGDHTFTEKSADYGLDFDNYSSSVAFLDYDLDGDLDIYLLNHAVHNETSFGNADIRLKRSYESGDKLLRNDGGTFTDVSETAGIYGGANGYGLGLAVSDFNLDGYPDIYVGNDFHEDDYFYLNNHDGTFREELKTYFGHTSKFSMGNDVADINHDGYPDILSLDMLPSDEKTLKSSAGDDDIAMLDMRTDKLGYHYQYARNMLHINNLGDFFSETALLSGIAATDWSWGALFNDYDQDGELDLFISNGIPKRPNDIDYINFTSNEQIRTKLNNTKLVDKKALQLMPKGNIPNAIFKGNGNLGFSDKSRQWIDQDSIISNGLAYGDFDNDGDLDLVTNNLNGPATLYINQTDLKNNYLKLKLKYLRNNKLAIGAKVAAYVNGVLTFKEHYSCRGFQSSSEPILHFGFGKAEKVDSLNIIWPDGSFQQLTDVSTNQTLEIEPRNTSKFGPPPFRNETGPLFHKVDDKLGIHFRHQEDNYRDFNRQKLMPYQISDRGPATSTGDLNGDGENDIFFGGSKYIPSKTYFSADSIFLNKILPTIAKDSLNEDISAVIADFNNDDRNDLFLGTGGADFFGRSQPLLDTYYLNSDSVFIARPIPGYFENASVVRPNDFDGDGDIDLFVGNQIVTNDFGKSPASYILINTNGEFNVQENSELQTLGMITDAIWQDYNNDGQNDLIVVGEWMGPTFFKNQDGKLVKEGVSNEKLNGLWQCIIAFDIDHDGDLDYLLGNWGENSKFHTTPDFPMRLYYGDFDQNGQTETITALAKNDAYYPLERLDGLSVQIESLRKKFPANSDFAGRSIEEIFDKEVLDRSKILEVHELRSGYLKNVNGNFTFVPFPKDLQLAPLTAFLRYDFDQDGEEEVLAGGNYFGVKPYHGRFGSFAGSLIENENTFLLGNKIGLDFFEKSVRHLNIIRSKNRPYLLATINNDSCQVYRIDPKPSPF